MAISEQASASALDSGRRAERRKSLFTLVRSDPLEPEGVAQPISAYRRDQVRRGLIRSAGGIFLGLILLLCFKLAGLTYSLTYGQWGLVCMAALVLEGFLFILAAREGYAELSFDPHFVYTPAAVAIVLFTLQLYFVPEVRVLVLMGWFVVLLFMAGFAGFIGVVTLSSLMFASYAGTIAYLTSQGLPFKLLFEMALALPFFLISIYAGFVLERMRSYRLEMKELRAELERQARTDALTRLANRRRFEEALTFELERCRRYGDHCVVALLDVDNFKVFNDHHGHPRGDVLLQELASLIRSHCRSTDLAARYGGEEFAIIMVSTDKERAAEAVERLRAAVERHPFEGEEAQPQGRLTISGGLAAFPDDSEEQEEVVRLADDALYRAKEEGRNRVRIAPLGAGA